MNHRRPPAPLWAVCLLLLLAWPAQAFDLPDLRLTLDQRRVGQDIGWFHFLSLIPQGSGLAAYYIDHRQCFFQVGRAVSSDGVTFSQAQVVVPRGSSGADATEAAFPGVLQAQGRYHLVYEARDCSGAFSVCYAVSENGIDFEKRGVILRASGSGAEAVEIGTPSLHYDGREYFLYYHGYDGRAVRILAARGPSLLQLRRAGLMVDAGPGGWDAGTAGKRSRLIRTGRYYYMFYEGSTAGDYAKAQWGVGLARARTPLGPWEKFDRNPILRNPRRGFGVDGPEACLIGGRLYLYFRTAENGTGRAAVTGLEP